MILMTNEIVKLIIMLWTFMFISDFKWGKTGWGYFTFIV